MFFFIVLFTDFPLFFSRDIWRPADSMISDVLKTLEFKSREESDAVQALKYSLEELGYDTFHSKVFIVITSKDKQVKTTTELGPSVL